MSDRLRVAKTYKLFVNGQFARSESGRHEVVRDHRGEAVGNVPRASRKDVRDAVAAARRAQPGWSGRTAYNRGQVLYRAAEALEARAPELAQLSSRVTGADRAAAGAQATAAVDRLVHYAGWTDKLHAMLGGVNPVALPYLSFSVPEPSGVVAVFCPRSPDLLGLVAEIAPALAAGNTVVALLSGESPLSGLDMAEVLAVSDVPPGVVNLLSGDRQELIEPLAGHRDVNAIRNASGDREVALRVGRLAAETIKRVDNRPVSDYMAPPTDSLARLEALMELKTAWHPVGA